VRKPEKEMNGAPGEIRTPDLLLRRTYRMTNQQFSSVCTGWDSLREISGFCIPPSLATKGIQAATGHKIEHTRIGDLNAPRRC
jgi:hypothetical protein